MGWSIDNVKLQIDSIFKKEKKRYKIYHPNAMSPRVYIQHEGEISLDAKNAIASLFPEMVYIDYFPNLSLDGEDVKTNKITRIT